MEKFLTVYMTQPYFDYQRGEFNAFVASTPPSSEEYHTFRIPLPDHILPQEDLGIAEQQDKDIE